MDDLSIGYVLTKNDGVTSLYQEPKTTRAVSRPCESFGKKHLYLACEEPKYMVSFLRDEIYDEDEVLIEEAPKVYEAGGSLSMIRD